MPADHNALVRYSFTRDQSSIYFRKEDGDFDKISVHGNKSTSNFAAVKASASPHLVKVAIVVSIVVVGLAVVAGAIAVAVVFSTQDDGDKNNTDGQTSETTTSSFSGVSTADSTTESSNRPESSTTSNLTEGSTTYSTGGMTSTTIYQNTTGGTSTQSTDSGTKGWSPWGSWTTCTASCGSGIYKRYRFCNEDVSTACYGDYVESDICSVTSCPEYGQWTTWTTWGSCDVTCGGGIQTRSRTCLKRDSTILNCVGNNTQQTACSSWKCPDCSQTCNFGTLNTACDVCSCVGNNVTGLVIAQDTKNPISNAAIYAATAPTTLLALSDTLGKFALNSTCLNSEIVVSRAGFQDITVAVVARYQEITMTKIVLPHMVQQPQSRYRLTGESVTFCCGAVAIPDISYYEWFKNSILLNSTGSNITISGLTVGNQGSYQCRANSLAGAIMSSVATLIVKENPNDFCADALQQKRIALPDDCIQPNTNTATYEVGECISKACRRTTVSGVGSCVGEEKSCCTVAEAVLETVQCSGYELELVVVKSCACAVCETKTITISGIAQGIYDSAPVTFAEVWVNGIFETYTNNEGNFEFVASQLISKLTINIQDNYFRNFLPAVKVIYINKDLGGTLIVEIRMIQSAEPILIASNVSNTLVAGATSEETSIPIVQVSVPPNAFYYPDGTQYNGTVKASLTFLDPKNSSSLQNIPGVFQFIDEEGQTGNLASFGVFNLFFTDDSGKSLILDEVIDLYIPNEANIGNNDIQLWTLNTETGVWEIVAENTGRRRRKRQDTSRWVGEIDWSTISDQTWYNYDYVRYLTNDTCFFKVRLFKDAALVEDVPNPNRYMELQYHILDNNVLTSIYDYFYDPEDHCVPGICEDKNAYISLYYYGQKGHEELFAGIPKLDSNVPYNITGEEKVLKIKMSSAQAGPFYENKTQCIISSKDNNHLRYHFEKTPEVFTLVNTFSPVSNVSLDVQKNLSRRAWYPRRSIERYRVCFIKVRVLFLTGTQLLPGQSIKIKATSYGGTNNNISNIILGIRESVNLNNTTTFCIEYKCSGAIDPVFEQQFDYTRVKIELIYPENDIECTLSYEADFVSGDKTGLNKNQTGSSNGWEMYAPTVYSPANGLYSATNNDVNLASTNAYAECRSGEPQNLKDDNPETGLGINFTCGPVSYWWYG